jgi:ADP-ribosylglycohydrolase
LARCRKCRVFCTHFIGTFTLVKSYLEAVPETITAFLEDESFEDVIRTAVSLGGDCDTPTCIASSIAEGSYGVPEVLKTKCLGRVNPALYEALTKFQEFVRNNPKCTG